MIKIDNITEKKFLEAEKLRSTGKYEEAIKIFKT